MISLYEGCQIVKLKLALKVQSKTTQKTAKQIESYSNNSLWSFP